MVFVRRAIIFVAQILALLFIVVSTMAGALAGQDWLSTALPSLGGAFAFAVGPERYFDLWSCGRILCFDNIGGNVFPGRRNREQHAEIRSIH